MTRVNLLRDRRPRRAWRVRITVDDWVELGIAVWLVAWYGLLFAGVLALVIGLWRWVLA
jgi:hypothetical protein